MKAISHEVKDGKFASGEELEKPLITPLGNGLPLPPGRVKIYMPYCT